MSADGFAVASSAFSPGDVIVDKYVLEHPIGRGGMGLVWAATHRALGERVALKFLREGQLASSEAVARFHREARAAASVQGAHVARVFDVGALPSGVPFLVMEYLDGRDLGSVLAAEGALPVARAVDYVLEAAEGVAAAHARGIVHRDLKPANLFVAVDRDGASCVKVLDFGISKVAPPTDGSEGLTATQSVFGSPLYMSPEQVRASKDVDARSDVWSLGVVLHHLIAGKPPFAGDGAPAIFAAIAADPPAPWSIAAPLAPPGLGAVIARCLEKSRDARFASVAELALALEPFASDESKPSVERIVRVLGESGGVTLDPAQPIAAAPVAQADHAEATGGQWTRTSLDLRAATPASGARRALVPVLWAASLVVVAVGVAVATTRAPVPSPSAPVTASTGRPTAEAAEPLPPAASTAVPIVPAPSAASASSAPAPRPRPMPVARPPIPSRTEF